MYKVYSKENCPQCEQAVALLEAHDQDFQLLKLGRDYERDDLLALAPNARSLPQIFKDGRLLGGLENLRLMFN